MKYERKDVVNGVFNCISKVALIDEYDIRLTSELRNEFLLDSLEEVEVISYIEDWFSIAISDDDASNCKTVEDAVNLVIKCLKDKNEYDSND